MQIGEIDLNLVDEGVEQIRFGSESRDLRLGDMAHAGFDFVQRLLMPRQSTQRLGKTLQRAGHRPREGAILQQVSRRAGVMPS